MSGCDVTLPIGPILAYWARSNEAHQPHRCRCTNGGRCASHESLAAALGISRSTLFRRIGEGTVTLAEADRWACALMTHPTRIWPGWDRAPVVASLSRTPRAEMF